MAQLQRLAIALSQLENQQITLTGQQQHYLYRVLRLRGGDRFMAMDGSGHCWLAELGAIEAVAMIKEEIFTQSELNIDVTLMAALPKGNSFDDVVRQSVELGVYCIMPVVSDRTLLNPSSQKVERWRRIAVEAAEQSERQIIPTILEPISFRIAVENCQQKYRYICVTRRDARHLLDCLLESGIEQQKADELPITNYQSIVIAIGPEGGWINEEVERAIEFSFEPVSLGNRILRAVTAPIVALSMISGIFDRG
ncbi:16S rRNA (uracil(1498)-N(3))-methyltransferase [Oscillatoriales cyanobacterium USR001]|nr:16S rRNA (uracil(1498)-N(3))-methyltransferase [Oscillatoriales cyanobacterium USR001]